MTRDKIEKAITKGVKNAESLMNRYTLFLYWLLRSHAAKDFSYDKNLIPERANELRKQYGGTEARLCEAVKSERQHIVPYKLLKMVFNLEGKARPGRHEVHNIGNLTYISHGLNSFKTGIGPNPLKLDPGPPEEPPDNLKAHLLMDQKGDLIKTYNNACNACLRADTENSKNEFKKAKQYFHKFSKARRKVITKAFHSWEKNIFRNRRLSNSIDERPSIRLIKAKDEDNIQDLGYPLNLESILVKLFNIKGMIKSRKQGPNIISRGFMRKVGKRKRVQVVRIDLYKNPYKIEIRLSDNDFQKWFKKNMPSIPLIKKMVEIDVNKPGTSEVVSTILKKLKKIS